MITRLQIKAARQLLEWDQTDLASKSGIAIGTIKSIESGASNNPKDDTLKLITQAFDKSGIEFIDEGVRKKRDLSHVLESENGVRDFYNDVANTAESQSIEVLVYAVGQEEIVTKLQSNSVFKSYRNRMLHADNSKLLMLRSEIDQEYKTANYMELRGLPKNENYPSLVYFVYADKVALVTDQAGIKILVIKHDAFAETYRKQFHDYWQVAKELARGE